VSAAWCWLKREGGNYKFALPQPMRATRTIVSRENGGGRLSISLHSSVATQSTGYIRGRLVRTTRTVIHSGNALNHHLDRLDLKVEGNQGKDKALHDGAQRLNCGPDVVKLAFKSCTR